MPAKNYYVVLGVSRDESPAGIRTAYHELARRMHPDITGPADTSRFQEINEAYEVLSDPDRRRAHDRDFGELERGTVVPVRHQPPSGPIAPEPISLFGQPEQTKPSFDAFRERYLRNFSGWNVPKAERVESLTLDVALSPAEAFCGCTIPVGVPVFGACPECGGTGQVFLFRCLECAGSGLLEEQRTLHVPRAAPGPAWDGSGGAARNVRDQQSLSSGAGFDFGRALSTRLRVRDCDRKNDTSRRAARFGTS
jgi:DnaJ-class molecular chaperone